MRKKFYVSPIVETLELEDILLISDDNDDSTLGDNTSDDNDSSWGGTGSNDFNQEDTWSF